MSSPPRGSEGFLPFGEGSFDAVTANFVLNHVGDPAATLTEMRRVLRPGGRLPPAGRTLALPTRALLASALSGPARWR